MLHVTLLLEGCGVLASSRVSNLNVTFHELTTLPPEWGAFPSATNISMGLIMQASMESLDETTAHLNSTLPSRFAAAPLPAKWWKARDIDEPSPLTQTNINEVREFISSYFEFFPPTTEAERKLQEHYQEEGFSETLRRLPTERHANGTIRSLLELLSAPTTQSPALPTDDVTEQTEEANTKPDDRFR